MSVGGFGLASPGKQDSDSARRGKYLIFVWYKALSQYKHTLSVQAPCQGIKGSLYSAEFLPDQALPREHKLILTHRTRILSQRAPTASTAPTPCTWASSIPPFGTPIHKMTTPNCKAMPLKAALPANPWLNPGPGLLEDKKPCVQKESLIILCQPLKHQQEGRPSRGELWSVGI